MIKNAYIAGPMSGHDDFNFTTFFKAADMLKRLGYKVFNPAEEDLKKWGSIENTKKHATYRKCLKLDLNYILDTENLTIFVLPNWHTSKGAKIEIAIAEVLKLPIIFLKNEDIE